VIKTKVANDVRSGYSFQLMFSVS